MDDNFVATLTKHSHGVIYLSCPLMDTIDSFKIHLKNWLQPMGYAFHGGEKNFSGGKGFSIPTKQFELCLTRYCVCWVKSVPQDKVRSFWWE